MSLFKKLFSPITALFSWLMPEIPAETAQGIDVTKADTNAFIPVAYGRCYGAGKLSYQATNDLDNDDIKNDLLHQIVIWSEGHCGGVIKNFVDDELSTSSRFNAPDGGRWYYAQNFSNGMVGYSDLALNLTGKRVTDTFEGKLCSYVRSEMAKDVWNGSPNHKAEFNGRLISATSGGAATASENPVDQLYDLLKSPIYGKGLDDSFIDIPSFTTARATCNTLVETFAGSGVNRKLFTSNIILDTGNSVLDNVNTLLKSMRGWLFHSDGKLKVLIEKDDAPVDFSLDESEKGFIEWGEISNSSKANRYNRVICRYTDPDSGWTTQEVVYPEAGSAEETAMLAADNGVLLEKSIALDTCIYYHEAAHHAKTICLVSREQLRTSVTWGPEAVILEVGDIVPAFRASVGWNGKLFRIESTEKSTENGQVELILREHQPYLYDDANAGDKPILPDTDLTFGIPSTPSNLIQTSVYNDFSQVTLSWDSGTTDHRIVIVDSNGTQLVNSIFAGKTYNFKGYEIATYSVKLYAIGGLGRESGSLNFDVDITQPPTSAASISISSTAGIIIVTPIAPGSITAIYEGLYTTSAVLDPNVDSVSLFTLIPAGRSLTILNPIHNQLYYIWYRLKTTEGNGAWLVVSATGVGLNAQQVEGVFDLSDENLQALIASSDREFAILSDRVTEEEIRTLEGLDNDLEAEISLQTNTVKIGSSESNISTLNIQSASYTSQLNQITNAQTGILAQANDYTFTGIGYFSGNTWIEGALSERLRNVRVDTANGFARVSEIAQAFEDVNGDLVARGGMLTDVNDRVSGFMTNNNGQTSQFDIISTSFRVGDYVGGNPNNAFVPYLYANAGQLIVENSWVRAEAIVVGSGTTTYLNGNPVLVNQHRVSIGENFGVASVLVTGPNNSVGFNFGSDGRGTVTRGSSSPAITVKSAGATSSGGTSIKAESGTGNCNVVDGFVPFTGKHSYLIAKNFSSNNIGKLCEQGDIYKQSDVNNAIFHAKLSAKPRNILAIGAYSQYESINGADSLPSVSAEEAEALKAKYKIAYINALGEGLLYVCSESGDIAAGQWLCSSSKKGYAMLQTDEQSGEYEKYFTDYTVAKASESVVWANEPNNTKLIAVYYKGG